MHRAILKTRDHVLEDGTSIPIIKEEVPFGTEYIVDCSKSLGHTLLHNTNLNRDFIVTLAWATRVDNPELSGQMPATVLEFMEDLGEA